MRPARPLELPAATGEQWEAAFRAVEAAYARNKSRRWVLVMLRDTLRGSVSPPAEE